MNRIGIISDIHANLKALHRSIELMERARVDRLVVCGDIVGYGRDVNECCQTVRRLRCPVVAGNHDWAVAGLTAYRKRFSPRAVAGIAHARRVITAQNRQWLAGLPYYYSEGAMEFVHATLVDPTHWYYPALGGQTGKSIWQDVHRSFDKMEGAVCFMGHSHRPKVFLEKRPGQVKSIQPDRDCYRLNGYRAIVDVGSVGLPRDSRKRASAVVYDPAESRVCFKRYSV